jgi:hypothetical protein
MKRPIAIVQALGVAVVLLSFTANADTPSADELKRSIQERAHRIAEYRALLNDPDQSVRLAALDTMLKSDDIAMRELAYAVAFVSTDPTMRAVALKHRIAGMQTVVITIASRKDASQNEKRVRDAWGGSYAFDIGGFQEKTGRFNTSGANTEGKGQVVGTTLEFSRQYCRGTFQLGEGAMLHGTLGCLSPITGEYGGTINLE